MLCSGIYLHMTLVSWKQATFFRTTFTFPNKSTWKINLLCIVSFYEHLTFQLFPTRKLETLPRTQMRKRRR